MIIRRNTYNLIKRTYKTSPICGNLFQDLKFDNKNSNNSSKPKFNRFNSPKGKTYEKNKRDFRQPKFNIESGTEACQGALKSIISYVAEISPNYKVQFIDPDTNLVKTEHLANVIDSLDLSRSGITCVGIRDNFPLIKKCKIEFMVKAFSDQKAKLKEQELLAKGSKKTEYAIKNREKALSKRGAEKVISCRWSINPSDLSNQKKNEIMKKLTKGENLSFRFQTNTNFGFDFDSSHISHNHRDQDNYELELKKRDLLKQTIESILNELPCTWTVEGDIETKLDYKIIASKQELPNKPEKVTTNEKKPKKKLHAQQPKTVKKSEEDLDALYSFKIEE